MEKPIKFTNREGKILYGMLFLPDNSHSSNKIGLFVVISLVKTYSKCNGIMCCSTTCYGIGYEIFMESEELAETKVPANKMAPPVRFEYHPLNRGAQPADSTGQLDSWTRLFPNGSNLPVMSGHDLLRGIT